MKTNKKNIKKQYFIYRKGLFKKLHTTFATFTTFTTFTTFAQNLE